MGPEIGLCSVWKYSSIPNNAGCSLSPVLMTKLCFLHDSYLIKPFGKFNSLVPVRFKWNFRYVIFKALLIIDDWAISCEIAHRLLPLDPIDDKLTLVQVMAWCHQASHCLSQCWPSWYVCGPLTGIAWMSGVYVPFLYIAPILCEKEKRGMILCEKCSQVNATEHL